MKRLRFALFVGSLCWLGSACAQYGTPASLQAELPFGSDLRFVVSSTELTPTADMANTVFLPVGSAQEKLPALVVHHTCSGLSEHIYQWSSAALAQRYVVLVLDTLTSRGLKSDCGSPSKIPNARWIKDELDAMAFLATLPNVDGKFISVLGLSKGGLATTWLASPAIANAIGPGSPQVAAVVSLYALCALLPSKGRPQGAIVLQPDTSRPLLMLLGESDNELSPESCIKELPVRKAAGAPVEWFVYPNTTHAWDKAESDGYSKVSPINGEKVVYRFNKDATADSKLRVFDFLKRYGRAP
jgi:dienelactone hydrolase